MLIQPQPLTKLLPRIDAADQTLPIATIIEELQLAQLEPIAPIENSDPKALRAEIENLLCLWCHYDSQLSEEDFAFTALRNINDRVTNSFTRRGISIDRRKEAKRAIENHIYAYWLKYCQPTGTDPGDRLVLLEILERTIAQHLVREPNPLTD